MPSLWNRILWWWRREREEQDLDEELRAHLAIETRQQVDAGRDPVEAECEARRAFGNRTRIAEETRDVWAWRWLDDLGRDVRFAFRMLRQSPGFALTTIMTLALGIGVNLGMFSVVNSLLLRPLYERPGEVRAVYGRGTTPSGGYRPLSYPNYLDVREGASDVFTDLAAFSMGSFGLDAGGGARRTLAAAVTANYFQFFDRPIALGRPFAPEDEQPGADGVAIISHALWEQLGADSLIFDRPVWVNGEPLTVVGVAAEGFIGMGVPGPEVWTPLRDEGLWRNREAHILNVVGRLRAGVSAETAASALAAAARRLEQDFPEVNAGYTLDLAAPSRLMFFPGPGGAAAAGVVGLLLMVMPAIVLLVACLNLANLLLARGWMRRRELAVRSSLGGGRGRLVRQLLGEGLLLALAGGALGLLLSMGATRLLLASLRPVIPLALTLPEFGPDWRVLAGTLGFSLLASLIFGGWPAWVLTGRAVTDLKRHAGEERIRPGGLRIGPALVIGQVALSLLLLASGGLFLMSAISAATADPGFRLDGGMLVEVDPELAGYDEARGRELHLALVDRLRALPGVEAATLASRFAFTSFGDSRVVAPAGAADAPSNSVDSAFSVVGRDYARTLGLPLLGGRDFVEAEFLPGASTHVAIIDDALAEGLWPGESALGRLIEFLDAEGAEAGRTMTVVGVIPAVKHSLGNPRPFPHVYVPLGQHYESAMTLALRVTDAGAEPAMLDAIARAVREVDARTPMLRLETWRDHVSASLDAWIYRAGAWVFSAFGVLALLLAVIGVYGVKSYGVSRRTREFGIRIAVGAHPRALVRQVLREGAGLTLAGIGLGLLLALGAGLLLESILYEVDAVEPLVLVLAPLILLAAALLAAFVPARRAMKVDPTVALRSE